MASFRNALGSCARSLQGAARSSVATTCDWGQEVRHLSCSLPTLKDASSSQQDAANCSQQPAHARHLHSHCPLMATIHHAVQGTKSMSAQDYRRCLANSYSSRQAFHGIVVSDAEQAGFVRHMIETVQRERDAFVAERPSGGSQYSAASIDSVVGSASRTNVWTVTAPIETLLEMSLA